MKIAVAKFTPHVGFNSSCFQVFNHGPHKEIALVAGIRSQGNLFTSAGHVCLRHNCLLSFFHGIKS